MAPKTIGWDPTLTHTGDPRRGLTYVLYAKMGNSTVEQSYFAPDVTPMRLASPNNVQIGAR